MVLEMQMLAGRLLRGSLKKQLQHQSNDGHLVPSVKTYLHFARVAASISAATLPDIRKDYFMPRLQSYLDRRVAKRFVVCVALLTLMSLAANCSGQQAPLKPSDLDSKVIKIDMKGATLEAMVALLAKQMNCNIVVDDSPHHAPIDFSMETTSRKALDRIANAYDYEWRLTKNGVLIFHKRFNDPNEFPQMNPAEWKQTAKDVLQILGEHDFQGENRQELRTFVLGLTPEQIVKMNAKKHLSISTFNEMQNAVLREYLYERIFETTFRAWHQITDDLKMLPTGSIQMRMADDFLDTIASQQEHRAQRRALTLFFNGIYTDGSAVSILTCTP